MEILWEATGTAAGFVLALSLFASGILFITLITDTRTYSQIRGILHQKKWEYTIDKMIKFEKPNDVISQDGYLEVWFKEKQQAEAYLLTLRNQKNNQTPDP